MLSPDELVHNSITINIDYSFCLLKILKKNLNVLPPPKKLIIFEGLFDIIIVQCIYVLKCMQYLYI